MKQKILLVMLVFGAFNISTNAQNKTIIISESGTPYTQQRWFYTGFGESLDGAKIKKNWDEGYRITSAAYTNHGWFVNMSKGSGIGMQTYKTGNNWPSDWIKSNWNNSYYITAVACNNNQYFVVMSQGFNMNPQHWAINDWNHISTWIKENWDKGAYITSVANNGNHWIVVMSNESSISYQGYLWASNTSELNNKISSDVWDKGYNIQLIESSNGRFLVVYCRYKTNNSRSQYWSVNPSDVASHINQRWNESKNIVYIGGGTENYVASNKNNTSSTSYRSNRTPSFSNPYGTFNYQMSQPDFSGLKYDSNASSSTTTIVNSTLNSNNSSSSSSSSSIPRTKCPNCNNGRRVYESTVTYSGTQIRYSTCSECGLRYQSSHITHRHDRCTSCRGSGYLD